MGKVTVYCGVRVLLISILLIPQRIPISPSSKLLLANCTLASVIFPAAHAPIPSVTTPIPPRSSVSRRTPMRNTAHKRGEADVDHADELGVGQAREDLWGGGSVWVIRRDAGKAKGDTGEANGVEAGKVNGVEEGNGRREDKTRRTHSKLLQPLLQGGPLEVKVAFPYTHWEMKMLTRVSLSKTAPLGMRERGDQNYEAGATAMTREVLAAHQRFSLSLAYSMGSTGDDTEIGEEDTDEVSESEEAGANEAMIRIRGRDIPSGDVNAAVTRGRVTPPTVLTADNRGVLVNTSFVLVVYFYLLLYDLQKAYGGLTGLKTANAIKASSSYRWALHRRIRNIRYKNTDCAQVLMISLDLTGPPSRQVQY
ncbi:hypothetical protein FIBSPDRAFT_890356 [Athelia psychrophila]|uniref:Uncharacterized protein n=1 Tax=Athelia psychrophila TaxID=1759441 RepID=A0A166L1E5_9AGAM|nr:hypothetical protein FIBSPDRAFT_890356 [Fibularhizoctonia sp. CBS 109695]